MSSAALAIWLVGVLVPQDVEPRLMAHIELRSLPAFEHFVTTLYEDQGFGDVFATQPRFDALRTLFPADIADRPCALALVLNADHSIHVIGLAPDSLTARALESPRARGDDVALHGFAEAAASAGAWLVRADGDEALARVSVDVRVLQAAWNDQVEGLTATLRGIAGLRAMVRRTSVVLDDAIALLERGACGLDAWDRIELRITPGVGRIECDATLVARPGSAAEHWLQTWTPLPIPTARIAFPEADLEGFAGPSDASLDSLFCTALPEALEAANVDEEFVRRGGIFAARAATDGATLAVPYAGSPADSQAVPEAWGPVASRCMAPLGAGDVVVGDCLYVRIRPAPWVARLYARLDANVSVPERAFAGFVELRGRVADGVLRLSASIERTALGSFVPVVRTR